MLPEAFLSRMQTQLGAQYPQYLAALERPRAVALRFNPLKGDVPTLPFVQEAVPWEPMGFYYDPAARPGLHPLHEAGVYYLQEASAMSAVSLLQPQPGERVCDLCAAPGGKSTQIAGRMRGEGFLLCNEIHPARARILSQNIERMGVPNALVTNESPETLAARLPAYFDRVLIDAPCSGEGMFRKEAAAVTDWSEETVRMCAQRQRAILESGAKLLRGGGRLVYSTCTFAPEENEETVTAFLAAHPEFSPEPLDAPLFSAVGTGMFRLWPHMLRGEGHFVAVLRKAGTQRADVQRAPQEQLPPQWQAFAAQTGVALPHGRALAFGRTTFWAPPELPPLHGLRVLRPGLELGEAKKDRFQPAHALALYLRECGARVSFPADSASVRAYLHGEELPGSVRGWCLICADGYSIGWAKGDGTRLKNHYPKGLRREIP